MSVEIRKDRPSEISSDRYEVPIVCLNCDAYQFAVIPKGMPVTRALRAQDCVVCEVPDELRKVVRS